MTEAVFIGAEKSGYDVTCGLTDKLIVHFPKYVANSNSKLLINKNVSFLYFQLGILSNIVCYVQLFLALPAGQESFSHWDNWWNCYSGIKDGCTRKEVLVDKSVYLLEPGFWPCNHSSASSNPSSTRFKACYPLFPFRHCLPLVKRFVSTCQFDKNRWLLDYLCPI